MAESKKTAVLIGIVIQNQSFYFVFQRLRAGFAEMGNNFVGCTTNFYFEAGSTVRACIRTMLGFFQGVSSYS